MSEAEWWWREYPERDVEYVRWYPPDIRPMDADSIWPEPGPKYAEHAGCYIHVPFCEAICPFCPFHKGLTSESELETFAETIEKEVGLYRAATGRYKNGFSFIYFGGGTPSILAPAAIRRIIRAVDGTFGLIDGAEISMEINPGFATEEAMSGFRAAGVNRLSFGVQSFSQAQLRRLGSHHSEQDSLHIVEKARDVGFDNVAIDLMFRLPGQTIDDWQRELRTAVEVSPDHISTYSLIVEPEGALGTAIATNRIPGQASDAEDMAMSREAFSTLRGGEYEHYASCASCGHDFAKPGRACSYETLHWQAPQAEYLGFGPAAYSFANGHIYANLFDYAKYRRSVMNGRLPVVAGKRLSHADHQSRFMVMGMKTLAVSDMAATHAFGNGISEIFPQQVERLLQAGLVRWSGHLLQVSELGRVFVDNISKTFYNDANYRVMQPLEPMLEQWTAEAV